MITRDFVRPGATVIDVGMNKVTDRAEFERYFKGNEKREQAFAKNGSTLVGDVHPEVAQVAGAITPVPGGVGPLTIANVDGKHSESSKAAAPRRGGDRGKKFFSPQSHRDTEKTIKNDFSRNSGRRELHQPR